VVRDDRFLVMGLNVIEPTLFFAAAPNTARWLAEAIFERS